MLFCTNSSNIHFFSIFLSLLLPFITANAVNAQVAYEVQYVGAEYGIGNVDVINCIQSKNGNIWVATKNQLYRFNGLTTQVIGRTSENTSLNIPDNHVQSIAEDQEGYIWACTLNGPTVIDPVHHKNIDLAAQVPALQSLFSEIHAVYNGENNAVFFMTTHDIYLYQDKTVTHICAIGTSSDNYTVDLCYHPKEKNCILWIETMPILWLKMPGYILWMAT